MHDVVPHAGAVTGTGEIKVKISACVNLILLFDLGSWKFQVTINRCYLIHTNSHHILGLDLYRRYG